MCVCVPKRGHNPTIVGVKKEVPQATRESRGKKERD